MTRDLTDDDKAALVELLREMIERDRFPLIARGGFTAVLFLQCMEAIGVNTLHLNGE
jgi:Domain of unknown function (DUF6471)